MAKDIKKRGDAELLDRDPDAEQLRDRSPRTRGQRLLEWIGTDRGNGVFQVVVGVPVLALLALGFHWFRWIAAAAYVSAFVGFLFGWWCARRTWLKHGQVPKI